MNNLGLLNLSSADQVYLAKLLELPFSHSEKKEVLQNIEEICLRHSLTLVECLDPILSRYSTPATKNRSLEHEIANSVRIELNRLRFPLLAKQELEFADWKKGLKLPQNISLQHAPNFEQDWIEVKFRYKSKEELHGILDKLSGLVS